jgi:hypothetical protein
MAASSRLPCEVVVVASAAACFCSPALIAYAP